MRLMRSLSALSAGIVLAACVWGCGTSAVGPDALSSASWSRSEDGGRTFVPTAAPAGGVGKDARCLMATFTVDDPAAYVGAALHLGGFRGDIVLNGKSVAGPLDDMDYDAIPLATRGLLVKGRNVVVFKSSQPRPAADPEADKPVATGAPTKPRLELYGPADVQIQTGPILGAAGKEYFTVTCRTNVPAKVTVKAQPAGAAGLKEVTGESPEGLYHKLKIALPDGAKTFTYAVTASAGGAEAKAGPFTARVPGADPNLRFVIVGDNRSYPARWASVLAGIRKVNPDMVFNTGDLVERGPDDRLWDTQFFGPAKEVLQTVPGYAVMGNHDQGAKVYFELIYGPGPNGRERSWSQTVGDVLFIGVDGSRKGGATPQWVEQQMAGSKAKFIFFLTHYPAWSSSSHGNNPQSIALMPVLMKYHATAMFAGHDHTYERIEPPADQGIPCIVSGGGGAPTYQKKRPNPNSKAFFPGLHFCLLEVKGDTCSMKVIDASGKQIDARVFTARKVDPQ